MDGLFGKYKAILAPMAGVTDSAFRRLCLEQGADLAFTEMVSAKGLSYANDKTRHLIDTSDEEEEVAVQLFGHESRTMAAQAAWIQECLGDRLVLIDVNMGCPARKIVKKGDGSALMLEPDLAADIISAIKNSVDVPVTAKFRRGYHEGEETAAEFAKKLEEAGADALTVHGRYAMQMYRGASDSACIAKVKSSVKIPVVGNGDIKSLEDAISLVKETSCDAVMIARGSLGNPWIFQELKALGDEYDADFKVPTLHERLAMLDRHAKLLDEAPRSNIKKLRKLAPHYIKGAAGAAKARAMLSECSTYDDFKNVIDLLSKSADE